MAVKETIAFIGNNHLNKELLEAFALQQYSLLIVANEETEKRKLNEDLEKAEFTQKTEFLDCPKDGCWEADIIAFFGGVNFKMDLLEKLKEFITQKTLIFLSEIDAKDAAFSVEQLQEIEKRLPNSKVVPVLVNMESKKVFISGKHPKAVKEIILIFESIGFEIGNK